VTREEEFQLIERVKNGDRNAFEDLVNENQKQVYNLALRMVGNEFDALDIAQEAFLKAYRSLGNFRGDSKFSVWLYRLTSNICIDFLRPRSRADTVSLTVLDCDEEEQELEIPDGRFLPEDELQKKELRASIGRGLQTLPDEYRRILVLRELGGMSYEELSAALDLDLGTVKSRLSRARKRLCAFLVKDGNLSGALPSKKGEGGVKRG
jgi:RNA polymerase sigma-70 factor (ECF subfamily)